jgi:hypothetical protein
MGQPVQVVIEAGLLKTSLAKTQLYEYIAAVAGASSSYETPPAIVQHLAPDERSQYQAHLTSAAQLKIAKQLDTSLCDAEGIVNSAVSAQIKLAKVISTLRTKIAADPAKTLYYDKQAQTEENAILKPFVDYDKGASRAATPARPPMPPPAIV